MNDEPGEPPELEPPSPAAPSGDGHVPLEPSRRMVEALVCPASGGPLEWDRTRGELISRAAGLAYPVRSGIPIMLLDEARRLDG